MDRNTPKPRVVLPAATAAIASLAASAQIKADELIAAGDTDSQLATIQGNLENVAVAMASNLSAALAAEATAKQKRQQLAVNRDTALAELRNLRDLILAKNPENPMVITEFGYEAYMSAATQPSEPQGDGTGDDPPPQDPPPAA